MHHYKQRQYSQLIVILSALLFSLPGYAFSQITFHTVEQGRNAIIDESIEPYFSILEPMEMQAKTAGKVKKDKLEIMRANTREIYQQAVLPFTQKDKDTLNWYVSHYATSLEKSYPLLNKTPWKFVKLQNHIEGALPHTRGDTIVLHEDMLNRLTQAKESLGKQALLGPGTVVVHELVHVAQRYNAAAFNKLYQHWGFQKITYPADNAWLKKHQLINPDGVKVDWVYPVTVNNSQHWIMPIVIWAEGEERKNMPADFRMRAIYMKNTNGKWKIQTRDDQRPVTKSITAHTEMLRAFPQVHGLYHPNEIAAEMIVNMMVFDHYLDHAQLDTSIKQAWNNIFSPVRQALTN